MRVCGIVFRVFYNKDGGYYTVVNMECKKKHFHTNSISFAYCVMRCVQKNKIPNSKNYWFLGSCYRLSNDEQYLHGIEERFKSLGKRVS